MTHRYFGHRVGRGENVATAWLDIRSEINERLLSKRSFDRANRSSGLVGASNVGRQISHVRLCDDNGLLGSTEGSDPGLQIGSAAIRSAGEHTVR